MIIRGREIATRTIAMVVGVIALVLASIFAVQSCDKRRNQGAQSKVGASQGNAAATSAGEAINTVSKAGEREAGSEELTRTNERDIRAAEGAGDKVKPGVNSAGRAALCRREAYKSTPQCKGVGR